MVDAVSTVGLAPLSNHLCVRLDADVRVCIDDSALNHIHTIFASSPSWLRFQCSLSKPLCVHAFCFFSLIAALPMLARPGPLPRPC
jgi:hypothetical protein